MEEKLIDPEYLKEVMNRCRVECPHIADYDYLVWINSIDYILREKGIINGNEEANEAALKHIDEQKKNSKKPNMYLKYYRH